MNRRVAMLAMSVLALPAFAQVEIRARELGPDDVRRLAERKQFAPAREIALQCARDRKDSWCEFYAGQLMFSGLGGPENQGEAVKLFSASAENGNPAAQAFLGNLYYHGMGVAKNTKTTLEWWELSAQNCNVWAQNATARSYYEGAIVPKSVAKAYYWIRIAEHFRFPGASDGVAVLKSEVTSEQIAAVDRDIDAFIKDSGCGSRKQVISFEP